MSLLNSKLFISLKNLSTIRTQPILNHKLFQVCLNNVAGYKDLPQPPKETVIGVPDSNKLRAIPKQPSYPGGFIIPRMTKRIADMRGPELVHNKLIHKQYGIIALAGGELEFGHFDMIRTTINRKLCNSGKVFGVWRVDPPWKPITRHGQGKKLGGGKGAISHYTSPVKKGRVIVEVGGTMSIDFLYRVLIDAAQKLPFPAQVVSQQDLENWENEEHEIKTENINKLRWEWCIKNNILNVLNYVGKYDIENSKHGPNCK